MQRTVHVLILAAAIVLAGALIAQTQISRSPAATYVYAVTHFSELGDDLQPDQETEEVVGYIERVLNTYGARGIRVMPMWPYFVIETQR